MKKKSQYNLDDVQRAVEHNKSIAGVLRVLGLRPVGGNYRTIRRIIDQHKFDTSHFTGQGWNVGLQFNPKKTSQMIKCLLQIPITNALGVFAKDINP